MKKIIIVIITIAIPFLLSAQDNVFIGASDTNWDTPSNWSTGKVPPTDIIQKITISSDCEVSNSNDYTFFEGSIFRIDPGVSFTNNGTGTWTMEGIMDNEGTYIGDLVITGNIEPGDNNISTWSCGDLLVYGGQSYTTVQIGNQCWMAENLNVGTMIQGNSAQMDNNIIEKYCYGDNIAECDVYGGLYQWNEMMQYSTTEGAQGVCPTGWHLPSDNEWMTLEEELGMCSGTGAGCSGMWGWRGTEQGSQLAGSESLWIDGLLDQSPSFGNSNFDVRPGGFRDFAGVFHDKSSRGYLWSSSENNPNNAWYRQLYFYSTMVFRNGNSKNSGISVRCAKD